MKRAALACIVILGCSDPPLGFLRRDPVLGSRQGRQLLAIRRRQVPVGDAAGQQLGDLRGALLAGHGGRVAAGEAAGPGRCEVVLEATKPEIAGQQPEQLLYGTRRNAADVAEALNDRLHGVSHGGRVLVIGPQHFELVLGDGVSGIDVGRHLIKVYAIAGLLAGLAGIVTSARAISGQAGMGVMYELDAIAAAVIGGASLSGGVGRITGTVIGTLILGVMTSGFTFLRVDAYYQEIVKGMIIVAAVVVDQYRQRRRMNA